MDTVVVCPLSVSGSSSVLLFDDDDEFGWSKERIIPLLLLPLPPLLFDKVQCFVLNTRTIPSSHPVTTFPS